MEGAGAGMEGGCQGWLMGVLSRWWVPGMGGGCQGWLMGARDGWWVAGDRHRQHTETSGSPPLQAEAVCQSWGWGWASARAGLGDVLPWDPAQQGQQGQSRAQSSHNSVSLPSLSSWNPLRQPALPCATWARGHTATPGCPLILHCPVGESSSSSSPGRRTGVGDTSQENIKMAKIPFPG